MQNDYLSPPACSKEVGSWKIYFKRMQTPVPCPYCTKFHKYFFAHLRIIMSLQFTGVRAPFVDPRLIRGQAPGWKTSAVCLGEIQRNLFLRRRRRRRREDIVGFEKLKNCHHSSSYFFLSYHYSSSILSFSSFFAKFIHEQVSIDRYKYQIYH